MILEILISVLIILTTYLYIKLYLLPQKLKKFYKNTLQGLGYKIYDENYNLFSFSTYRRFKQDAIRYKDSNYTAKIKLPKIDVNISNIVNNVVLELTSVELIKEFYHMQNKFYYEKGNYGLVSIKEILGQGLLMSEGQLWKKKRKLISQVFNHNFLMRILPTIGEICLEKLKNAQKQSQSANNNNQTTTFTIIPSKVLAKSFSAVIVKLFFGTDISTQQSDKIIDTMLELLKDISTQKRSPMGIIMGNWFFKLNLRQLDRKINKNSKQFHQFCVKMIDKRIKSIVESPQTTLSNAKQQYQDLVEAMLKTNLIKHQISNEIVNDENYQYTHDDLIKQFSTFFLAGTQTTSSLMRNAIYLLGIHPEIQQKLRKQIKKIFKEQQKGIDYIPSNAQLSACTYMQCFINQTLRMYSPVGGIFIRKAVKDHYLANVPIKKGTYIGIRFRGACYNSEYFKNPFEFNPERWQTRYDGKNLINQIPSYAFINFSAGQRNCIGQHLAMLQAKMQLFLLLNRYKNITVEKNNATWNNESVAYTVESMETYLQR